MNTQSNISLRARVYCFVIFYTFLVPAICQTLEQQHKSQLADKASKEAEKKRALIEAYKKSFDGFRLLKQANMVSIHFEYDSNRRFSACVKGGSFITDGVYLLLQTSAGEVMELANYDEGFHSYGYKVCGKLDNKGNFLNPYTGDGTGWAAQIQLNAVTQCQQEGQGRGKIFFKNNYLEVQELNFGCGRQASEKPWVVEYFSKLNTIFEEKCYRPSTYNRCPVPEELKKLVLDFKEENKPFCQSHYQNWTGKRDSSRSPC